MAGRIPRQFDWLRIHLGFYDNLNITSAVMWEELLGNAIDRYVVQSVGFMKTPIPERFASEKEVKHV